MKPYFAVCSQPVVRYRGRDLENSPVNLNRVNRLEKGTLRWYPDNEGIPSIQFVGIDSCWAYDTKEKRDSDFERLSKNEA